MTRILIVDDDTNNQRVMSYILRKAGFTVSVASDGVEGLAVLAGSTFDMAIIDLAMPLMDGLTMLRRMRSLPAFEKIPVMMLTASGDDDLRQTVEAESGAVFLTKPSSSRTVLQKINQILGEAGPA